MRFIVSFLSLFLSWIFLSGYLDAFHLTLGVISSLAITLWSIDYYLPNTKKTFSQRAKELGRFITYSGWLFKEIVVANLQVIKISLSPNLLEQLDPQMVTFKTKLKDDLAQFVLANSITLTPGTVTVRIKDGEYLVHALNKDAVDGLDGSMEDRVQKVFGS